jgi:hypothetical protein
MAIPMLSCIIKRVDTIGLRKKQGRDLRFVNCNKEPYEWMDKIAGDDPNFQGPLKEEEEVAVHPDIRAKLPGRTLEDKMDNTVVVVEDNEPDFQDLAAITFNNAGIDPQEQLWAALTAVVAPFLFQMGA